MEEISLDEEQERDKVFFPFEEEFSAEEVVNRPIVPENIDNDKEEKQESQSIYISKKDLAAIFDTNPDLILHQKDNNGEFNQLLAQKFSNKKLSGSDDEFIEMTISSSAKEDDELEIEETDDIKWDEDNENYYHFDEEIGDYRQVTEEDIAEIKRKKKIRKSLLQLADKFEDSEYPIENKEALADRLKEEFNDYISAPMVSGNTKRNYSDKYIPSDALEENVEKVEFADLEFERINKEEKKTSILINRNINSEIASLEVLCKCGERTLIKFDDSEENEDEIETFTDNTVLIVDAMPDTILQEEKNEEADEDMVYDADEYVYQDGEGENAEDDFGLEVNDGKENEEVKESEEVEENKESGEKKENEEQLDSSLD